MRVSLTAAAAVLWIGQVTPAQQIPYTEFQWAGPIDRNNKFTEGGTYTDTHGITHAVVLPPECG